MFEKNKYQNRTFIEFINVSTTAKKEKDKVDPLGKPRLTAKNLERLAGSSKTVS